jgi:DNA-binding transcriptional LysR family regulator
MLELVAAGRGITFVPRSISDRLSIPSVRFVPVVDGPVCTVNVATPTRPTPAAQAFVRSALRVLRRPGDAVVQASGDRRTTA